MRRGIDGRYFQESDEAMIKQQTAMDIALAYREIEAAEGLRSDVEAAMARHAMDQVDIRDAFGRRQDGLQLGVPSGQNGHRLFNVPWKLALPIIDAHLAQCRATVALLSEAALAELAPAPKDTFTQANSPICRPLTEEEVSQLRRTLGDEAEQESRP